MVARQVALPLRRASAGNGPVAATMLAPITMATLSAGGAAAVITSAASPFCRHKEDPCLLLESTMSSLQ